MIHTLSQTVKNDEYNIQICKQQWTVENHGQERKRLQKNRTQTR